MAGGRAPQVTQDEVVSAGIARLGLRRRPEPTIELRYAQEGPQQLAQLAAELVNLRVDVILANGDLAPRAAQQATGTIPIVAFGDDIVGAGLVASLSRPGGNTTGLTILSPELSAKRLEVLREIIPALSRVCALWDPHDGPLASSDDRARSALIKFDGASD